jgi:hypothetical protein
MQEQRHVFNPRAAGEMRYEASAREGDTDPN